MCIRDRGSLKSDDTKARIKIGTMESLCIGSRLWPGVSLGKDLLSEEAAAFPEFIMFQLREGLDRGGLVCLGIGWSANSNRGTALLLSQQKEDRTHGSCA